MDNNGEDDTVISDDFENELDDDSFNEDDDNHTVDSVPETEYTESIDQDSSETIEECESVADLHEEQVQAFDYSDMEPVELWNALSESGNFSTTGGELVFDETIALDEDQSSMLSIIIELINNEIKPGYLIANDSDNGILLHRSELTADVEVSLTNQNENMTSTQALTEKSGSHSCSYEQVHFNDMCRTNYNYIKNILNQYTSWNSGYIAAISAWIAKVNNNGDWDYKTSSYYGPWDHVFCNISDGQNDHVTSEYILLPNWSIQRSSVHFGLPRCISRRFRP